MIDDKYKTVKSIAEGLYKEKGSRFISYIYPVKTETEIKEIITETKTKFFDARHHCYAYALGLKREHYRTNDDGEPSGTAGKPIYGQILSHDLTNVLIVVVRYFGGTKLGVSGLITAYKEAALDAIENADVIEETVTEILAIHFNYLVMNDVMKVLKEENPDVLERNFENECNFVLSVPLSNSELLKFRLSKIESVTINSLK